MESGGQGAVVSQRLGERSERRIGPLLPFIVTILLHCRDTQAGVRALRKKPPIIDGEGITVAQHAWTPDRTTEVIFLDAGERLDNMYIEVLVQHEGAPEMVGPEADILTGN